jgi:hypothetical protein
MRPRLSSHRRYELRKGLQEAAKARGEPMTKEDADYCIDKALATGVLDSVGDLNSRKPRGNYCGNPAKGRHLEYAYAPRRRLNG